MAINGITKEDIKSAEDFMSPILRNKNLSGKHVTVFTTNESQGVEGILLYESRNGILFASDRRAYEVSFYPWNTVLEITLQVL